MSITQAKRGTLTALTGPFCCGKTKIAERLVATGEVRKVRTVTTRPPRTHEINGKHYDFYDDDTFRRAADAGKFLETATINGFFYGTPRSTILDGLARGRHFVVCIDPQGIESLLADRNELLGEAMITIYLEVSLQEAIGRYLDRDSSFSRLELERRMKTRETEETMKHICQYVIPNPNGMIDEVFQKIRLKIARRKKQLHTFV